MKHKLIALVIIYFITVISVWGAPGDPVIIAPEGEEHSAVEPAQQIPLDGGISILIAAGIVYGTKRYRDYKKQNKVIENM